MEIILIIAIILLSAVLAAVISPRSASPGRVAAAAFHDTHDPNAVETNDDFVAMTNFGQAQPRFPELRPPQIVGGDPNRVSIDGDG